MRVLAINFLETNYQIRRKGNTLSGEKKGSWLKFSPKFFAPDQNFSPTFFSSNAKSYSP